MQHLQSVQQIFQDKLFFIPDYQRGYSWEQKQWQDLLEDIELIEEDQEHYTGTLVIHPRQQNTIIQDDDGNDYHMYDVVDGQQRLTTLTILLNEIARKFSSLEGKRKQFAVGIRKKYAMTFRDEDHLAKLTLNRDTNDFFRFYLLSNKSAMEGANLISERRLAEAAIYFDQYFSKKLTELGQGFEEWLEKSYNKVISKMKLTVYLVPQATDVGIIFEVMNNRGKKLTNMEKVKNYLLYLTSKLNCEGAQELGEDINRTWTFIYESLMTSGTSDHDEDQLLRNHWLMYMNYSAKHWDGSDSVKGVYNLKKYVNRHKELRTDIRGYVHSLKESCVAYCDILTPARTGAFSNIPKEAVRKSIVEYTNKILRIGTFAAFIPMLMATRIRYSDNMEEYLMMVILFEKYAFRVFRMGEKRSNAGQSMLYKLGYEVYHNEVSAIKALESVQLLMLQYMPNEDFEAIVDEVGDWYNWFGLKYLLYEYELHLSKQKPVLMDWVYLQKTDKQDSIEHILPQTSTQPYWNRWSKKEIDEAIHDIGNLVITFDNSSYGNKGFDQKKGTIDSKHSYINSSLFSERELAKYAEWTYSSFLERRLGIARWMKDRWKVEDIKNDAHLVLEDDDAEEDPIELE